MNKPNNSGHNNNKRSRGRNNGRRPQNPGNRSFESNGPEVKVRGSASQICDKYLALARDASSSGDRVRAESLLQHAEHYYRLVNGGDDARTNNARQAGGARRGQGPGEVTVAGEMQTEDAAQEEQQGKEQRPSRRERARNAPPPGSGRRKAAPDENAGDDAEDTQEEAEVESTVVQVGEANDEQSGDDAGEGEAVVIAEPVPVVDASDDEPESEVA